MTLRFMSRAEIASYLGVSLSTVKQYANFPQPDVVVGRNQGWAMDTIDAWLAGREGWAYRHPLETQKRPPAESS